MVGNGNFNVSLLDYVSRYILSFSNLVVYLVDSL